MTETLDPWEDLAGPSTRTPRSLETREKTERVRQWKEPTLIPDPEPRDGWAFKWVRAASRGTDDKNNVEKRRREGWEAVRAEDHPEILAEWRSDQTHGLIEHGGLLLCKMPQEMVDQRRQFYDKKTRDGLNSAEEHYMRDDHELMRKISENRRKVVFGPTSR